MPDFLAETTHIRQSEWKVAPLRARLTRPPGLDSARWCCRSYTTRIAEVQDFGKPTETALPPNSGYGFLWRLNSYWRFHERNGGVDLECRAISLTCDVPKGLGWIIDPIVRKSLVNTLEATRRALAGRVSWSTG
jgi:hypothetical protein